MIKAVKLPPHPFGNWVFSRTIVFNTETRRVGGAGCRQVLANGAKGRALGSFRILKIRGRGAYRGVVADGRGEWVGGHSATRAAANGSAALLL